MIARAVLNMAKGSKIARNSNQWICQPFGQAAWWYECIHIQYMHTIPRFTITYGLWAMTLQKEDNSTSWANQVTAREVDWPCPAQLYVFWCDFRTRCSSCTNPQTESRPFYFFLFLSERYERNNDPKKHENDHNLS